MGIALHKSSIYGLTLFILVPTVNTPNIDRLLQELKQYRGRLAPSPTGYLHLGHARTFWTAQERARAAKGTLVLRNEDLDRSRVRSEFIQGFIDDLTWFGFGWDEGPDIGGPFAPYDQS